MIGNPDLEPEKTWRARAEWEHKFGARAALTLAVFHDQVEDVQDFIPRTICVNPIGASLAVCPDVDERTFDAPGNIGDGTRTGIEVRAALPLSPLMPNAELRLSGLWQETDVTDPAHWRKPPLLRREGLELQRRFPPGPARAEDGVGRFRCRVIRQGRLQVSGGHLCDRSGTRLDLFAETTQIAGVTVRVSASNIFHPAEERIRTFYTGSRASGVLLRTEERKQKGGPEGTQVFSIRLSGTF